MTMGIMPVTGIPLPFMCYGGSAIIASFAGIGLVLNVHMRRFTDPRTISLAGAGGWTVDWLEHDVACGRSSSRSWPGCRSRPATSVRATAPSARSTGPDQVGLAARLPRHLRDRPAQPGPADPLRDPQRARRRRGRALLRALDRPRGASCGRERSPLFSVDTHRPAGEFDLLAFNLSAELVYTNVLNCIDLAGVPVRGADRRPEHPLVVAGGHCTYNPEPLADFVDFVRDRRRRGGRRRDHRGGRRVEGGGRTADGSREAVLHDLATVPGVYVPSMYDVELRRPAIAGGHAPLRRRARDGSRSAPSPTWPTGPTRSSSWCRSPRSSTTGSTSRSSGAAPAAAASARPA